MKSNAAPCPITEVALLLSDTWTMLILHHLLQKPQRFCELEKNLATISTRTLTLKLKKLTEDGLIEKADEHFYKPTRKAKGIRLIENAMRTYQKRYLAKN